MNGKTKECFSFRPTLFWDINFKKLDIKKDAPFIIGRVLDLGNLEEWKNINNLYSLSKIRKVAENHIFFNSRSANFWSIILNIPLRKLKCTRRPLLKTPKTFSTR